ncbi:MAG: DUF3795 domain-containing protein [Candidatus Aenigmarchaeota archaeon]|nr:DUF3795 domain-containing protein [Candidatus Aenigmarchaeota archaeon]
MYKKDCEGCKETEGKPFYVKEFEIDVCPVWKCATEHKIEHCGLCEEFPCDKFLDWYDPKRDIITVLRRAGLLALRNKIGTEAWIEWLKNKKIEFGV